MIKPIQWLGDSLENVREFSDSGRYHVGRELRRVQTGEMPTDWKPMITVGPGVAEIRIHAKMNIGSSTSQNLKKLFMYYTASPKRHNKPRNATSILPQSVTVNCTRKGQKNECTPENN